MKGFLFVITILKEKGNATQIIRCAIAINYNG